MKAVACEAMHNSEGDRQWDTLIRELLLSHKEIVGVAFLTKWGQLVYTVGLLKGLSEQDTAIICNLFHFTPGNSTLPGLEEGFSIHINTGPTPPTQPLSIWLQEPTFDGRLEIVSESFTKFAVVQRSWSRVEAVAVGKSHVHMVVNHMSAGILAVLIGQPSPFAPHTARQAIDDFCALLRA